jgi:uncharacterized membrane protein
MLSRESVYVICTILALAAIPLILKLIGPNRYYGFRIAATLSNELVWFKANTFLGYALITAVASTFLILFLSSSISELNNSDWLPITALIVPLLIAVTSSIIYVSRLN